MPRDTKDAPLSWRLIPFEDAHIQSPGPNFNSFLVVEGVSPYANMEIDLVPLVYSETPEYWGVEVCGCLRKMALPAITPFEQNLVLDFPVGNKGIEVFGADGQSIKLDFVYNVEPNPNDGTQKVSLADRPDASSRLQEE